MQDEQELDELQKFAMEVEEVKESLIFKNFTLSNTSEANKNLKNQQIYYSTFDPRINDSTYFVGTNLSIPHNECEKNRLYHRINLLEEKKNKKIYYVKEKEFNLSKILLKYQSNLLKVGCNAVVIEEKKTITPLSKNVRNSFYISPVKKELSLNYIVEPSVYNILGRDWFLPSQSFLNVFSEIKSEKSVIKNNLITIMIPIKELELEFEFYYIEKNNINELINPIKEVQAINESPLYKKLGDSNLNTIVINVINSQLSDYLFRDSYYLIEDLYDKNLNVLQYLKKIGKYMIFLDKTNLIGETFSIFRKRVILGMYEKFNSERDLLANVTNVEPLSQLINDQVDIYVQNTTRLILKNIDPTAKISESRTAMSVGNYSKLLSRYTYIQEFVLDQVIREGNKSYFIPIAQFILSDNLINTYTSNAIDEKIVKEVKEIFEYYYTKKRHKNGDLTLLVIIYRETNIIPDIHMFDKISEDIVNFYRERSITEKKLFLDYMVNVLKTELYLKNEKQILNNYRTSLERKVINVVEVKDEKLISSVVIQREVKSIPIPKLSVKQIREFNKSSVEQPIGAISSKISTQELQEGLQADIKKILKKRVIVPEYKETKESLQEELNLLKISLKSSSVSDKEKTKNIKKIHKLETTLKQLLEKEQAKKEMKEVEEKEEEDIKELEEAHDILQRNEEGEELAFNEEEELAFNEEEEAGKGYHICTACKLNFSNTPFKTIKLTKNKSQVLNFCSIECMQNYKM